MRLYETIKPVEVDFGMPGSTPVPGFTLSEIIDSFYLEGVVPDFIPADLGEDAADEVDEDGNFIVDPRGNIRTDPMDLRESELIAGIYDPEQPRVISEIKPPVEMIESKSDFVR